MIIDGRSVPEGETISADVCVVGAGPAGLTVAHRLAEAGLRVVVAEAGPLEPSHAPPDTAVSVGLDYPIAESRARAFGGTSTMWRVRTHAAVHHVRLRELDDDDFRARAWVRGSGWPVQRDELMDAYRDARALFGIRPTRTTSLPDLEQSPFRSEDVEVRVFDFAARRVFTEQAQASMQAHPGVTVLTNTAVIDVRSDGAPHEVSSLTAQARHGVPITFVAQRYVLAMGALENARLLLLSTSRFTNGVGNRHDLVGRFFMEHPHCSTGLFVPNDPALFDRNESFAIHGVDGYTVQKKYGIAAERARSEELLGCAFSLNPAPWTPALMALREGRSRRPGFAAAIALRDTLRRGRLPDDVGRLLAEVARGLPDIVRHGADKVATRARRRLRGHVTSVPDVFKIEAMAEQVPNPDSRVLLTSTKDRFGLPELKLDWRLTREDLAGLARNQELFGAALERAGLGRVQSLVRADDLPPGLNSGPHHMGTTRMSDDAKRGVVDRHARVHGIANLYVAGSSVFPTGGYANPTLTIVALALRLADHLLQPDNRLTVHSDS